MPIWTVNVTVSYCNIISHYYFFFYDYHCIIVFPGLKSDLEFEKELLKKELEEVKHRMEIEVTQVDCKVREEYDEKLQDALNQLREMYDGKMRENREDLEKLYEERVKDLQSQLSNARGNNASTLQELKESKSRIASLMSKVSDLEGANLALNQKIADLAQEMEDLKGIHRAQIAAKDDEIQRLLDELANQLKEYQDLQVHENEREMKVNSDFIVFTLIFSRISKLLWIWRLPFSGDSSKRKKIVWVWATNLWT